MENNNFEAIKNKAYLKNENDLPMGFKLLQELEEAEYLELLDKAFEESKRYDLNPTYVNNIFEMARKKMELSEQEQKYLDMWIKDATKSSNRSR